MAHPTGPATLDELPPSVGDAPFAAVLLRDLAAALVDRPPSRRGAPSPAGVAVEDDGHFRLTEPAGSAEPDDAAAAAHVMVANAVDVALSAPELFADRPADARTDAYAAGCLALTRYLGRSPVAAVAISRGASSTVRLAAIRQGHRAAPARLGAMPAPFRAVFAQALAKEPHLRPTPAALVALLDSAFAAAGPDAEAEARARVRRLVVLAHAFVPTGPAVGAVVADEPVRVPLHLPPTGWSAHSRPGGAARAVLIGAVAVVAAGGVLAVAILGVGGRNAPVSTPLAVSTQQVVAPTTSPAGAPVASTPAAAGTTSAVPARVAPAAGTGARGTATRGTETSARPTPTRTPTARHKTSHDPAPSTPPTVVVTPTPSTPPASEPPTSTPPKGPPTSDPPTSDPPTSTPPTSTPPTDPPTSTPPSSDPPTSTPPATPAA